MWRHGHAGFLLSAEEWTSDTNHPHSSNRRAERNVTHRMGRCKAVQGRKGAFAAIVPDRTRSQAHPYVNQNEGTELSLGDGRRCAVRYLNRSSKAFRALVGACGLGLALDSGAGLVERAGVAGVLWRDARGDRSADTRMARRCRSSRTARRRGGRCRSGRTWRPGSRPWPQSARCRIARSGRSRGSRAC